MKVFYIIFLIIFFLFPRIVKQLWLREHVPQG